MEVRGVEDVERHMTNLIASISGNPMVSAMRAAVMLVLRSARQYVPVDTGRLRADIGGDVSHSRGILGGEVIGVVGSRVTYAPFVETGTRPHWPPLGALARWAERHGMTEHTIRHIIGTRGTRPHPYMLPAVVDNAARVYQLLNTAVRTAVTRK